MVRFNSRALVTSKIFTDVPRSHGASPYSTVAEAEPINRVLLPRCNAAAKDDGVLVGHKVSRGIR